MEPRPWFHKRCVWLLLTCAAFPLADTRSELSAGCSILDAPPGCVCEGGYLLRVTWFGRLGNNLLQLSQALHIAELTESEVTIIPDQSRPFFNKTSWDFRGNAKGGCQIAIPNEFFYSTICPSLLHKEVYRVADKRRVLQTHILPFFQIPISGNSEHVVIHIRSGDVFSSTPPPTYTQPPFAFYKVALGLPELKRLKIVLCTEDSVNPVVHLLKKEYGRRLTVIEDLNTAISTVIGAKRLLLGQSSFSELLGMMAPNLEMVYIPFCSAREDIYVDHKLDGWGLPGYCFEYENYIGLDEWANTAEQLQLMTSLSTDKVRKFALPVG